VTRLLASLLALALPAAAAAQVSCGNDVSGFSAWKQEFAALSAANGVGERGLTALQNASYDEGTIRKDRNQSGFRGSLAEFMERRGASTIVAQGRRRLEENRAFYDALERAYGVPAGVLIAIHGMETAFGNYMGDHRVISSILTVAYDCRRQDFFIPHALAALVLVDRGAVSPDTLGAAHGELGHTQFLPGNALRYGQDGNGDGRVDLTNLTDAMASTANFLRQKGWQPGQGYQPGEPNFAAIQAWNAASVYQQAIAVMAAQIQG
jgi:membrane-bound lytic murein transglycosylase B